MGQEQKNILLAEDDSIIATSQSVRLKDYGYGVVHVLNGQKAVEILNETIVIVLILMDINLGKGIDGIETAELILKKHDLTILFISNHT